MQAIPNYKTLQRFQHFFRLWQPLLYDGNFLRIVFRKILTVFSPITSNYRIHSYVMIHKTVSVTESERFYEHCFLYIEFVFLTALFLPFAVCTWIFRPLHWVDNRIRELCQRKF